MRSAWRALGGLLAAGVLAAAAADSRAQAAAAGIERQRAEAQLLDANPLLTPYFDSSSGTLLVHLQPRQGGAEVLLDARSGRPWSGTPAEVMTRFARLGVEPAREVQTGRAWDQRLLQALGCAPPLHWCSSPADAEVLLFVRSEGRRLHLETIDLRGLFARMDTLMAGRIDAAAVSGDAAGWQLLEHAAHAPARRQRWLDALRGIDSRVRWRRVAAAAEQGPRLLQWAALGAAQPNRDTTGDTTDASAFDLAGELERLALRLHIERLARATLAAPAAAEPLRELADGLLLAGRVGFRGDLASALVDVLLQFDAAERDALAKRLSAEAERRRSHGLWCYAAWMTVLPCGGTPPWEAPATPVAPPVPPVPPVPPAPRVPPAPSPASAAPAAPASPAAPAPRAPPAAPAPGAAFGGDAPQEWAQISTLPNRLQLLNYDETSGHLAPESGAAAGLAFVARSLGPLQEGRFELQVSPNARAPLQLRHGAYRVRVRLVLDYAREDRCRSGLLCLFAGAERHARTERRDVVFTLLPGNRFVERRRAEFGHLLPLAAQGSLRYLSTLTQARLAIEAVRFELM